MWGKAQLELTLFFHEMTAALFTAGPNGFQGLDSYQAIDTCTRRQLKEWLALYEADGKKNFNRKCSWLLHTGYRHSFNEIAQKLFTMPAAVRSQFLSSYASEDKDKLICASQVMNLLTPASILAYDFALLTAMYKAGHRLYYLSEADAYSNSIYAAKTVQDRYSSWYEYHYACIAGAYFQSPSYAIASPTGFTGSLLQVTERNPAVSWKCRIK
ncbi:hypothetical protein DCC85_05855 [Paenibacillus sp. CAA11]|uniref:DUF1266 domain-containing protein n=1 Tax=Paenibacillus sp. CAA11 TaxID=1532905 RepID=UPI000D33D5D9|nr:DUF1266 domain-containing protein [Paenibacillus sp. CAA11]AWB43794.1 hypothetical protein DCC85_05855 [Paenibacillus sp. CAA11]